MEDLATRLGNDLQASVGSTDSAKAATSTFENLKNNLDALLDENVTLLQARNNAEFKLALQFQNTGFLEEKLTKAISSNEE